MNSKQVIPDTIFHQTASRNAHCGTYAATMPVEVMHAVYVVEGAAEAIGKSGGLQDILAAMRTFPDNVELCATCCNAIWSLSVGGGQQYSVFFFFFFFF